jgi:tetratricopeptide (TPR) repeat protein
MCEGITHLPQLSNNHISSFFYYRSILYLYLDDYNNAITDVDKAIEKSEDNISKYFYLRGLISSIFGNFSQAVQDHSVAINLDSEFAKAYLERAKCLQIEGNANEAFSDLQKFITLCPEDQYIHKYAGYLLFQNCAYEDCLTALKHGEKLANDSDLTLTKAKCHFLLG